MQAKKPTLTDRVKAIEVVLKLKAEDPPTSQGEKVWASINTNRASFILAVLTVVAIPFIRWYIADTVGHQVEAYMDKPGGINQAIKEVQTSTTETNTILKTLQPLIDDVVKREFDTAAKLSPQALAEKLAPITDLIRVANNQDIRVQQQLTEDLSKNLLRVPHSTTGYWPATSQLIAYRTAVPVGTVPPKNVPCRNLNVNIDRETGPAPGDIDTHIEISDCTFDLEDNPNFRGGGFPQAKYLVLHNVRIRYGGGPINDLPPTIVFDHCTFDFSITNSPPTPVLRLTNALLAAADLDNLSYSTGKPEHSL